MVRDWERGGHVGSREKEVGVWGSEREGKVGSRERVGQSGVLRGRWPRVVQHTR